MQSFLDELIELELLEDAKKKKHYKKPSICTVCNKVFDNPMRWKTCSLKCRFKAYGKHRIGKKIPESFRLHRSPFISIHDVVDLSNVHETDPTQKVPEEPKEKETSNKD